jgi:hypothetical protein
VVEIALISCSGDVNATETVLKANFEHFAEHDSEAFAPDPTPAAAASGLSVNSWSDELFPLSWGDVGVETQPVRPPPQAIKKEQPPLAPKETQPTTPPRPTSPPKSESPAFEIPKAMLGSLNDSFITDLSRYNELLGITDEDSDEEEDDEEGSGSELENRDHASLWNEYLGGTNSLSSKQEVLAPAMPPTSEGR